MNPQIVWEELLRAYAEENWDVIEERASALLRWLDDGGHPPHVQAENLGPNWNRALARAGCMVALEILQSEWRTAPEPA